MKKKKHSAAIQNSPRSSTYKSQFGIDLSNLFFIAAVSFLIRFIPVLNGTNWTDLYEQQAIPILKHLNIYSSTHKIFPYSPVSMFLPALCAKLSFLLNIPFSVIMKLPSVMADVCIDLALFVTLVKIGQKDAFKWALLYAVNPVSILITAFHGNVISIATLFSFLSYVVLLFGVDKYYRLSALLLGIAIGFRGYPVLLLPVFLLSLKISLRNKISYLLHASIPTALSFIPFIILDYKSVLREVFAYSGFPDYGIGAILRAVYSLQHNILAYGLPNNLIGVLNDKTKIIFFIVYIGILFLSSGKKLITLIMAVFLAFYSVYSGISSQYFIWLLPFAFLIKDKMLKYYVILITWAMVNFYWLYHPYIIFGKLGTVKASLNTLLTGEVISLSLSWVLCLLWLVKLIFIKYEKTGYDFL